MLQKENVGREDVRQVLDEIDFSTVLNQNTSILDIHDQRVTGFCLAEADCLQTAQTAFAKFWPCGPCMHHLPCLPNLPVLLVGWHKQQSFQTSLP